MNDQDTAQDPSKFYAMLGRALTDSSFRQRLTNADREVQRGALVEAGITGNDAIIDQLRGALLGLDKQRRGLRGGQRRWQLDVGFVPVIKDLERHPARRGCGSKTPD